jgi:hypothetical protein
MVALAYAWLSPLLIVFSILLAGGVIKCIHNRRKQIILTKGEQLEESPPLPKETTKDSDIMSI